MCPPLGYKYSSQHPVPELPSFLVVRDKVSHPLKITQKLLYSYFLDFNLYLSLLREGKIKYSEVSGTKCSDSATFVKDMCYTSCLYYDSVLHSGNKT
jgi:hypothetical protein